MAMAMRVLSWPCYSIVMLMLTPYNYVSNVKNYLILLTIGRLSKGKLLSMYNISVVIIIIIATLLVL